MSRVQRSEIVDFETYEEERATFRARAMREKDRRRIHMGDCFTLLLENHTTVRYQIQEMMRSERIVKESDILHEIETYNGLLGEGGAIGASLLIEIDDPAARDEKLRAWRDLPGHLYARLDDGTLIRAAFDEGQRSDVRLSSVQYLKFPVSGRVPAAFGIDLPGIEMEARLSDDQRAAIAEDLTAA